MNDESPSTELAVQHYAESPNALSILLDDRLFRRCEIIADKMANATGVTPIHLLNKPLFTLWSSAFKMRRPFARGGMTGFGVIGMGADRGAICSGMVNQNSDPSPTSLMTPITSSLPSFINWASCLQK